MNIEEFRKEYGSHPLLDGRTGSGKEFNLNIVALVKNTKVNKTFAVSYQNYETGTCGCCCEYYFAEEDLEILKIVNLETMETIYEH